MTGASLKPLCWFEKKQTILDLNGLETNVREKKKQFYIKYSRSATQLGDSRVMWDYTKGEYSLNTSMLNMIVRLWRGNDTSSPTMGTKAKCTNTVLVLWSSFEKTAVCYQLLSKSTILLFYLKKKKNKLLQQNLFSC